MLPAQPKIRHPVGPAAAAIATAGVTTRPLAPITNAVVSHGSTIRNMWIALFAVAAMSLSSCSACEACFPQNFVDEVRGSSFHRQHSSPIAASLHDWISHVVDLSIVGSSFDPMTTLPGPSPDVGWSLCFPYSHIVAAS